MGQIDIRNLMKVFGDGDDEIVAVDGHDFTIEDGEFLILVGPSGCGKSTTLRCIAGLERPTSGQIILDGEDVTGKKPRDRDMAMVFQNYALYPHMTARENMSFGLKMATDLSESEIEERVTEAAQMMGIESLLDDKPKELSGGQQQRVALGRAIVREPEVFLMDEPLSNLDAKLRTQMRTELQQLQQNLDITTIYVTHDQEEAMTMGDKIAVLKDGKLQQLGSPLELYHQPANQFVAGFIGSPSMNFLEVALDDSGATPAFVHDGFEYELDPETHDAVRGQGTRFVLGIRPEGIKLAEKGDPNSIHADVTVVEPLGDVTYVYLEIGRVQVTAQMDGELQIEEGTTIPVEFPKNLVHVFDAETGESLKHRVAPQDTTVADLTI